ncbi:MAG: FAD-dependent monooxygenase, partial [Pseudomonadota bacterium]
GGGIGGMAAALALALRGASVTVLEQSPEITEVGAGLQISPNGMSVLSAWGVADALVARSVPVERVRLRNHRDGLDVVGLDVAGAQYNQPWLAVHRADLLEILTDAARSAGVQIELGASVEGVIEGGRKGVTLSDGRTVRAGVIVAADGVKSNLRSEVERVQTPAFRGQVAWRALVPGAGEAEPPEVSVFMGPGSHVVRYPLRAGDLINLVAVKERRAWAEDGWNHSDDPSVLRAAFEGYAPEIQADLAKVDEVHLWGLHRRPVAKRWTNGRVALLGDAAHATLPFLAQGAVMAIEDAWVLADCLVNSDTVEVGLALYESRRKARCRKTVASADRNAWAYHLRVPVFRDVAHLTLGLGEKLRPGMALGQYDWLYRKDVTAPGEP